MANPRKFSAFRRIWFFPVAGAENGKTGKREKGKGPGTRTGTGTEKGKNEKGGKGKVLGGRVERFYA